MIATRCWIDVTINGVRFKVTMRDTWILKMVIDVIMIKGGIGNYKNIFDTAALAIFNANGQFDKLAMHYIVMLYCIVGIKDRGRVTINTDNGTQVLDAVRYNVPADADDYIICDIEKNEH